MTPEYDEVPGEFVSPELEGEIVPCPPEWVVAQAELPDRFRYACLSAELQETYHPGIREVCVEYVKDYLYYAKLGRAPLLLGYTGVGKSWAAAATLNELIMRYGHKISFTTSWLSVQWGLGELVDLRRFRRADYHKFLNHLKNVDFLAVDDLLHVSESDFGQEKKLLMTLLAYRHDQRLPTLVTANASVSEDDWSSLVDPFTEPFVRRLRDVSEGITIVAE